MARDIKSLLRQQAALATFGSFAFRETDLGKILSEAAQICAESLDTGHCKVCRYRAEENDLLIEAGFGWDLGVVGRVVSRADESSPQGRTFVTGQPVIIPNLREANDYEPPAFYVEHGIVSTVDVLIKGEFGHAFGVLEIDSTTEHTYDQHDIDFLTGFANVLAEAVATSRRNEALRVAMADMQLVMAAKDRLLEERNLLAVELQHRVRNNLQLINDMVGAQLRQTTNDSGRRGLQGIVRQIMSLAEVYQHLLDGGMSGRVDLGGYVAALCANLPDLQPPSAFPITLHCDARTVWVTMGAATALGLVLTELISNSYEHAFPGRGGSIEVGVSPDPRIDQGVITVGDDGVGYTPAAETRRRGVGLVRRLMQQVLGTVDVVGSAGTVWTLRFPAFPTEDIAAAAA